MSFIHSHRERHRRMSRLRENLLKLLDMISITH